MISPIRMRVHTRKVAVLPFQPNPARHDISRRAAWWLRQQAERHPDVDLQAAAVDLRAIAEGRGPVIPAWLVVAQVAEHLELSERRVRELLDAGRLVGTRKGTDWRVSQEALQEFSAAWRRKTCR